MTNGSLVPSALKSGPFTTAMARRHSVSKRMLDGPNYRRLFRGVYVWIGLELSLTVWLVGALLILPLDSAVSHATALRLYGIEIGRPWPLQFSTNTAAVTEHRSVTLHRRLGRMTPRAIERIPVLGPDRTFVDAATQLGFVQLVQAAEMLLNLKHTTREALWDYAMTRHLDGVVRARRVLHYVREGVESPMETLVRLMIIFARLPEPEPNPDIFDLRGNFVARGDLVYFEWKVLVEYDGWQHERDPKQRQRDRERREALEALGWRVIVVTSEDLRNKREVVRRVHRAIEARGYEGASPVFNDSWDRWFPLM